MPFSKLLQRPATAWFGWDIRLEVVSSVKIDGRCRHNDGFLIDLHLRQYTCEFQGRSG